MAELKPRDETPSPHVLVVAPFRSDAAVLSDMLERNGMAAIICTDEDRLAEQMGYCSMLVMSQEALTANAIDLVATYLENQPAWSELPVILLIDDINHYGAVLSGLTSRLPQSKMMILQRPVRAIEFVSVVQTALIARRRQLQLRDHIEWQQELQRELNHRVKNILANVTAIFHMTIKQSDDLEAFAESFEGRLNALAKVHTALAMAQQAQPLQKLAEQVLAPYRSASRERVIIEGPEVLLQPDGAVLFALCLHELATNAAKYGAFSTTGGSVSLTWAWESTAAETCVKVIWAEAGGPPVAAPARLGYGTKFVRSAMCGKVGATTEIQYHPEGLVCTFVIPVAGLAKSDEATRDEFQGAGKTNGAQEHPPPAAPTIGAT